MAESKKASRTKKTDLVQGKYHSYGRIKLPSGKYRAATPEDYSKKQQFLLVEPGLDKRRVYKEGGIKHSILSKFGKPMHAFLLDERLVGMPVDLDSFMGKKVDLKGDRVIYMDGRYADEKELSQAVDARLAALDMTRRVNRKVTRVSGSWKGSHTSGLKKDELKDMIKELRANRKSVPKKSKTGKKDKKSDKKKSSKSKDKKKSKKSKSEKTERKSKSKDKRSKDKQSEDKDSESKSKTERKSKSETKDSRKDSSKKDKVSRRSRSTKSSRARSDSDSDSSRSNRSRSSRSDSSRSGSSRRSRSNSPVVSRRGRN